MRPGGDPFSPGPFLAVGWGRINQPVYRMENGAVAATERDSNGTASVTDYPNEAAEIGARFEASPATDGRNIWVDEWLG